MEIVSNKDRLEIEIQVYTKIVEDLRDNIITLNKDLVVSLNQTYLSVADYNYLAVKIEARIDQLTSLLDTYKNRIDNLKLSLALE